MCYYNVYMQCINTNTYKNMINVHIVQIYKILYFFLSGLILHTFFFSFIIVEEYLICKSVKGNIRLHESLMLMLLIFDIDRLYKEV